MQKIKDALISAWKAACYSFAFCFRNNRRDTLWEILLLVLQTVLGYGTIIVTGKLISSLQAHITQGKSTTFSVYDFIRGGYFIPIVAVVAILFGEIIISKVKSFISTRRRHILRFANALEMRDHKASLDIACIRSKLYDDVESKIEELPDGWFTRISFSSELMGFVGTLITFALFGISLAVTHPFYVFVIIITAVPMLIAEFKAVNSIWKLSLDLVPHSKQRGVLERAYRNSTSFLQAVMFNQLPTLRGQIKENQNHVIKLNDELRFRNMQITLATYLVAMAGLSFVLLHSVWNTLSIGGDLGVLTVILASSRRLQASTRDIVLQIASQWSSVKGIIIIEEEYFAMRPLLQTIDPVNPQFNGLPRIRFENVCFSYPQTDTLVLRNILFTVEPGSKVTIVGRNGSGKSSLMSLLLRHYDPTSGKIVVGDIPLRSITPQVWSGHASALLQEFAIHDRKIAEEIASSRLDRPLEMDVVRESARFAEFESIVEKDPLGYSSQIGIEFGGRDFSGGEKQRLALARARYRQTPIFILDEPDARLDPETSQKLAENIFALKDVTVIMVTQHVSRAIQSDNILVLDDGELVEQGTHDELLTIGGKYASMFEKDKRRLGA